jgi:mannan endo-1,4-beta-mannosidase
MRSTAALGWIVVMAAVGCGGADDASAVAQEDASSGSDGVAGAPEPGLDARTSETGAIDAARADGALDAALGADAESEADAADAFVGASGTSLVVDGKPLRFFGLNSYNLAGGLLAQRCYLDHTPANYEAKLDDTIRQLGVLGATAIRFWAYQNYAGASGDDFTGLEHVIAKAKAAGIRVVMTLEDEWDSCSPPTGKKGLAWYTTDYKGDYGYPLSYRAYVAKIVAHFKDEPSILMWQLMNEAECPDAAALRAFASDMAALVKSIDPRHLLSFGTMGGGQQGTQGADYETLHRDPNIDLVEAHDYNQEPLATPPNIAADWQVAQKIGKPFFIGEAGISTQAFSRQERATYMDAKIKAAAAAGYAGFLLWSFALDDGDVFGLNTTAGDPLEPLWIADAPLW